MLVIGARTSPQRPGSRPGASRRRPSDGTDGRARSRSRDPPASSRRAPETLASERPTKSKPAPGRRPARPLATAAFRSVRRRGTSPARARARPQAPRPAIDCGTRCRRPGCGCSPSTEQRGRRVHDVARRLDRGTARHRRRRALPDPMALNWTPAFAAPAPVSCKDDMRFERDQHVVPWTGQSPQRDLVGHRAARQEERRLGAEQLRDLLLEAVDRWVLAVLVVADFGVRHCRGACGGRAVTVSERRSIRSGMCQMIGERISGPAADPAAGDERGGVGRALRTARTSPEAIRVPRAATRRRPRDPRHRMAWPAPPRRGRR